MNTYKVHANFVKKDTQRKESHIHLVVVSDVNDIENFLIKIYKDSHTLVDFTYEFDSKIEIKKPIKKPKKEVPKIETKKEVNPISKFF